jgi:formamidopyrimidine-DNA glycosylase
VPELPEVETIRIQLEPLVVGRRFERVRIIDARLTRPFAPDRVAQQLTGERVEALERRGKYLLVRFGSGRSLLVHLRMTGSLRHVARGAGEEPHLRAVVELDDDTELRYHDVRRFGTWLVLEEVELAPYLAEKVGEEPLAAGFSPRVLARRLSGRRAPLKAAILDQLTVAGMGNIYADEALWRARLHPLRPAGDLEFSEVRRLHRGVRDALKTGIRRKGATLSNYATPDGRSGAMQEDFRVYGREFEPCRRCGSSIEKTRVAGRGTWYCPRCQDMRSAAETRAGSGRTDASSRATDARRSR